MVTLVLLGKEASCVAGAFLGKCASITAVDLIQRKILGSRSFLNLI